MKVTHAVILAAGSGSRMAPFHLARPKCLLPLLNEPLLLHLYRVLVEVGITTVTMVVNHADRPLIAALDSPGLEIQWVVQSESLGSGMAAMLGQEAIPVHEPLIVIEGDVWIDSLDLRNTIEALNGYDVALLLDSLGSEKPGDWIIAGVHGTTVRQVLGHPREGQWRVSGLYALSSTTRSLLGRVVHRGVQTPVGGMPHREYDVAEVVNTVIGRGGRVRAAFAQRPVVNWDKPWHLLQANWLAAEEWAKNHRVALGEGSDIHDTAIIRGAVSLGKNSHIGPGAIIEGPVIVGDNVTITDYAKVSHAVVGHGCVISHTAEFLGGVLMENVYLMHNCELYGVFGENVDIGAGTVSGTLRFDDAMASHRVKGRWETPTSGANASFVGDFSRTGVNAVILPGKHVGPYAVVGPNVVVDRDIEGYTQVLLEQSWKVTKWGPERYGW